MTSESATSRPSDVTRILILMLLVAGLRTFTVWNTTVPSRDCIIFVRDGLRMETPPDGFTTLDVIRGVAHAPDMPGVEHPPGYPAAIIAMSWLVRPLMGGVTTESMALSAQLVSAVSAVLLVVPLFLLTRRLFDRNVALAAVAIFQVLPVYVDVSSDGISDSFWLLTAAWAICFAVRAVEQERIRPALLFGLVAGAFCGLGYWIRPEAGVVALAAGVTSAGLVLRRLHPGTWKAPFVVGLGLVFGTIAVMGPYCAIIGGLTHKKSGQGFFKTIQGEEPGPAFHQKPEGRAPGVNLPLAEWWDPQWDGSKSKSLWAARAVASEYSKAAHYVIPWFALIGLVSVRRRLAEPGIAILLMTAFVHFGVLWIIASRMNYVSQRHTLLTVMISCTFAAASFPVIGNWVVRTWKSSWIQRWTPWQIGGALTILVLALALPRDFRSLHHERAGNVPAGHWLRDNAGDVKIIDPLGWAEWYSGRTLREWPWLNPTADRELYIVFTPNSKSPHSRLERYDFAYDRYKESEENRVFSYPPGVSEDKIEVAVYHFKPKPKEKK
jgi:hypothetical protein